MPRGAALRDIERYIAIELLAGFNYETFLDDTRSVYAVTRCLEIISEVVSRMR
jgi:uncharacterized protein with HEPN domain